MLMIQEIYNRDFFLLPDLPRVLLLMRCCQNLMQLECTSQLAEIPLSLPFPANAPLLFLSFGVRLLTRRSEAPEGDAARRGKTADPSKGLDFLWRAWGCRWCAWNGT